MLTKGFFTLTVGIAVLTFCIPSPDAAPGFVIEKIQGEIGNPCSNPVCLPTTAVPVARAVPGATGYSTSYRLFGPWVDKATKATFSRDGVSAFLDEADSTFGNPSVKIRFSASSDADLGEHTVTLRNSANGSPDPTPLAAPLTMKIQVVNRGVVRMVRGPRMDDSFRSAALLVYGTQLRGAKVDVDMANVTGTITEADSDSARLILTFPSPVAEAKGRFRLYDGACNSCKIGKHFFYKGTQSADEGWSDFYVKGVNAVKTMTIRTGAYTDQFVDHQTSTVTVTLIRPAEGNGDKVYWSINSGQVNPSSGELVFTAGQTSRSFTTKVDGYTQSTTNMYILPSSLRVETRINNPAASSSPAYKAVIFGVKSAAMPDLLGLAKPLSR